VYARAWGSPMEAPTVGFRDNIIPLIDNLEILRIFKDEDKEEGDGVTDALSIIL